MAIRCGIVGLPNVGKSTIFNALTAAEIAAENYPFCTIDPNVGIVPVPDARLDRIADIVQPKKVIPTTVEFVDIAGLVEGASRGEGLGNQFLAHIRETHAIAHVVRCFDDDDVTHVSGRVSPVDDAEIINTELALADLASVEKTLEKAERAARAGIKDQIALRDLLRRVHAGLAEGTAVRAQALSSDDLAGLRELHLLTAKPVLYVANVTEGGHEDNPWLAPLRDLAVAEGAEIVTVSAALEAEIAQLEDADRSEFLAELGMDEPGLARVIRAAYRLLGLQTFFTAGPKEARAWTVRSGATAPQGAGEIHTDFERGFIRAEVIAYDDFIKYQGEQGAREAGRLRVEGKEYVLCEGDVVHFRFNV